MDVKVRYAKGKATLIFGPEAGQKVYFKCNHPDHEAPQVYDFAAFACVVLAHKFETNITLQGPVTKTALKNCAYISEFFRLVDNRSTSYDVIPKEIVEDREPTGQFRSLCLSSGIDSTYALLIGQKKQHFTHTLVVHGADFRPQRKAGFERLFIKVAGMSKIAGLTPVIVQTNLRKIDYNWGMFHIVQLAACMHFLGPKFSDAAFAADKTVAQDLIRFPWGNNSVIGTRVGGDTTRVHYLGENATRYEKIKAIQADGRFLNHIGVCAADKDHGENCGLCSKCMLTRIAFECQQGACPPIFREMPVPKTQLEILMRQKTGLKSRGIPLRANETLPFIDDPELRETVIKLRDFCLERQRRREFWKQTLPYRIKRRIERDLGLRKK